MSIDAYLTSGSSPSPHFLHPASVVAPPRRCRIAILGLGTVGTALARRLRQRPGARPRPDAHPRPAGRRQASHARRPRSSGRPDSKTSSPPTSTSSSSSLAASRLAAEWIECRTAAGKSVVTANKQVMARFGASLLTLAARQGRQLRFEAAVGGAMPIVRALGDGLSGDRVTRITAILNGTSNSVLSDMDRTGCTLAAALAGRARTRLCRGGSVGRHRRARRAGEAGDSLRPGVPASGRSLRNRHPFDCRPGSAGSAAGGAARCDDQAIGLRRV